MLAIATPEAPKIPPVRLADRRDENDLVDMVRRLHEESALIMPNGKRMPLDIERVRQTVQRAVIPRRNSDEMPAWVGVIGNYGELQGSVYLSCEMFWYSSMPIVAEVWNYCLPEYRKSNNARALIEFAKASADAIDAMLTMGVSTAGREEAKARFYRRHLGNPVGQFFVHKNSRNGTIGGI